MATQLGNANGVIINPATEETALRLETLDKNLDMIRTYLAYLANPSWVDRSGSMTAAIGALRISQVVGVTTVATVTTVSTVTNQVSFGMPSASTNVNIMQAQVYPIINAAWSQCVRARL